MTRIIGTLHEDIYTFFFIISRSFLLRKRNISDKFVEEIKTHILCAITFSSESRADYVILWKNMVESDRP